NTVHIVNCIFFNRHFWHPIPIGQIAGRTPNKVRTASNYVKTDSYAFDYSEPQWSDCHVKNYTTGCAHSVAPIPLTRDRLLRPIHPIMNPCHPLPATAPALP